MITRTICLLLFACLFLPDRANARIVINEVFYHAPDDLEDLEYIEFYNSGEEPVDLTNWGFSKGIKFKFEPGTQIAAKGFVVICRNRDRFQQFYDVPVAGVFAQKLSNSGERLQFSNAAGRPVDTIKYQDAPPWPAGADGFSASLERICPDASGEDVANWAASPLSKDRTKPAGTPGKVNANFAAVLPPVISKVKFTPEMPLPDQPVSVEVDVNDPTGVRTVNLLYRLAGPGFEKDESSVAMSKVSEGHYTATIPGQAKDQLIRFRIEASNSSGSKRFFPGEHEPRPALSTYVHESITPATIPFAWIIDTTEAEFQAAQQRARSPGGRGFGFPFNPGLPPPEDPNQANRARIRTTLQGELDIPAAWFELTVNQAATWPTLEKLRPIVRAKSVQRDRLIDEMVEAPNAEAKLKTLPDVIKTFRASFVDSLKPLLRETDSKAFAAWLEQARVPGPASMIQSRVNLEAAWYAVSMAGEMDEARFGGLRAALKQLAIERAALIEKAASPNQRQEAFREVREQADDLNQQLTAKIKPLLSPAQAKQFEDWRNGGAVAEAPRGIPGGPPNFGGRGGPGEAGRRGEFAERGGRGGPFRFGGGRGGPFSRMASGTETPSSGRSAFLYFDPTTKKLQLFDFVHVTPRSGGQKVHFYKDQTLNKMTGINLIFESDQGVLIEPLAYEVYKKAGMATPLSYHVRLWLDAQPVGYYLLVEQPNRGFLRRNKIPDDGNLYKILWYEQGVVGQHEKKTHTREGHDDVVALISALEKTEGNEQWEVIKKNFDVEQVVNYFAVNTVLSHWDGFFNNYLTYHDTSGSGRWTMYPWDQDNTWGTTMGFGEVFFNMPITFGMNGDVPPGQRGGRGGGRPGGPGGGFGFGGGGAFWWRQPGYFSGPLLANPEFRKHFLARTKEILETIYTEETFNPIIDAMGERLKPEVKIRAELFKTDPARAQQDFEQRVQSLREHVKKRREFLLAQNEVKNAGKFSRAEFDPPKPRKASTPK